MAEKFGYISSGFLEENAKQIGREKKWERDEWIFIYMGSAVYIYGSIL